MEFTPPLQPATLLRRYKRFLADVRLPDGRERTVHTPNTGAMLGCSTPGSRIWLRDTGNPKRKYPLSWEASELTDGTLVGVNTGLVNRLVAEGIDAGVVAPLQGYATLRSEVRYGHERSRIDLLLEGPDHPRCYVEIKNVTARDEAGCALFPDAVTTRGSRHLRELMRVVEEGERAVLLFCVQRSDAVAVRPADEIDPRYGATLRAAAAAGVELLAYRATVTPETVRLTTSLPVILPHERFSPATIVV